MLAANDYEFFNINNDNVNLSDLGVLTKDTYYNEILQEYIKCNNWDIINNMPITFDIDGSASCFFYEDSWLFSELIYNSKKESDANIYFNPIVNGKRVSLNSNIKNQVKCYAVSLMFFTPNVIKLSSVADKVSRLVSMAYIITEYGVNDLGKLTIENILNWSHDKLELTESSGNKISILNELGELSNYLPFQWGVKEKITLKKLGLTIEKQDQTLVIPSRIYMGLLEYCSKEINRYYKDRDEINMAIEDMFKWKDLYRSYIKRELSANKKSVYKKVFNFDTVSSYFKANGLSVYDVEHERWNDVWSKSKPVYRISDGWRNKNKFHTKVGCLTFNNVAELKKFITNIDAICKWLCLALSGMRTDELFRISLHHGCQDHLQIQGRTVYFFTTKQSKITFDSQLKDDVFITTETGYKAYKILCDIHSPFINRYIDKNDKEFMFSSINFSWSPKAIGKRSLSTSIESFVNNINHKGNPINMILNRNDIIDLNNSDLEHKYKEGDIFSFTPHQLRRSLSFYTIGYELMSYPQLKQQLGHYSMVMTMVYARNSSSINKIFNEINDERIEQKSKVISNIYSKILMGETIAGGKGKALIKEIKSSGKSYFESDMNKRKVSVDYWEREIRTGRVHLHAVAPGIYCTNNKCSIRVNVDLSGCIDCEFDYIENAVYVESSRLKAIKLLNYNIEQEVINKNDISRWLVQIKSAEKILKDLGLEYDVFKLPKDIECLLLDVDFIG